MSFKSDIEIGLNLPSKSIPGLHVTFKIAPILKFNAQSIGFVALPLLQQYWERPHSSVLPGHICYPSFRIAMFGRPLA
jgi:hypothetical protein